MEYQENKSDSLFPWKRWWPTYIATGIWLAMMVIIDGHHDYLNFLTFLNEYSLPSFLAEAKFDPQNFLLRLTLLNGALYLGLAGFFIEIMVLYPYDVFFFEFKSANENYFNKYMLRKGYVKTFDSYCRRNIICAYIGFTFFAWRVFYFNPNVCDNFWK
jgi:hypothetical protein